MKTKKLGYLTTAVIYSLIFVLFEVFLMSFTQISPIASLFSFSIGSIIFFICTLFPSNRLNRVLATAFLYLLSFWFLTQSLLFKTFGFFYPPETIFGMASDVATGFGDKVVSAVIGGILSILLFFAPPILFTVFGKKLTFLPKRAIIQRVACITLAFLLGTSAKTLVTQNKSEPMTLLEEYTVSFDFDRAVPNFGLLTATRLNAVYSVRPFPIKDDKTQDNSYSVSEYASYQLSDIDLNGTAAQTKSDKIRSLCSYFSNVSPTEKNEYSGIFKGKNLIFITAEALSPYAISSELTPTLYRLKNEGFVFTDYYQPSFGESTSGGEYSLLLSQVPKRDSGEAGMTFQLASKKTLEYSLPALFADQGYTARGFHNNSYTYYKRNITHPKMKMSWYGCGGSVTHENNQDIDLSKFLSAGWPRSDCEMVKATVSIYAGDEKPFFTYYLTVSGHNNYSFSENAISRKNESVTSHLPYSESVRSYLSAQYELERGLSELISELEACGKLNDTVIALSNDHYPYGLSASWKNDGSDPLAELYGKSKIDVFERERGVFFVWSPEISEPITVNKPVSSFDVMPTLLNLFGIEYDSRLLTGRDALAKGDGLVFFSDMSWKTSKASFSAKNGNITLSDDTEDGYKERITKEVKDKIYYSKMLRKHSLFDEIKKAAKNGS